MLFMKRATVFYHIRELWAWTFLGAAHYRPNGRERRVVDSAENARSMPFCRLTFRIGSPVLREFHTGDVVPQLHDG